MPDYGVINSIRTVVAESKSSLLDIKLFKTSSLQLVWDYFSSPLKSIGDYCDVPVDFLHALAYKGIGGFPNY
jgi:hypothetical protein